MNKKSEDYIRTMVNTNKAIYIDTASLMESNSLERFIKNAEGIFYQSQRKIIVPQAVCLELCNHMEGQYSDKGEKAFLAHELITTHTDMFDIRNSNLDEKEVTEAFADKEILAELMRNKTYCRQLLITNDKGLSKDAYNLNRLASCRGYKVMVCFLNEEGEMRRCECCRGNDSQKVQEEGFNTNREVEQNCVDAEQANDSPMIQRILIPAGAFIAGILANKYGKTAAKFKTTVF